MQQENTTSSSSSIFGANETPLLSAQMRSSAFDLINQPPYSDMYFCSGSSPSASPEKINSSPVAASEKNTKNPPTSAFVAANCLSRLMSEHQSLLNHHALCLMKLQKTFKEAETLRQENTNLRIANHDLSSHLELLIQTTPFPRHTLPQSERFEGLSMKGKKRETSVEGFSSDSPTSVIENNRADNLKSEAGGVNLPKSISVRSNEFLKMTSHGVHLGTSATDLFPDHGPSQKKVYVRGGSKKEGAIELEVYNQGMYKTELCNKWQESRSCPYGEDCQFAHGIEEMRPVIRHPRYKTEVCRMILSGGLCPYGHRCHFRHALTQEEKLMFPQRPY